MRRWIRWLAPAVLGAAALILTIASGTAIAKHDGRPVKRVVMFASDGMRPDLMEKYAKAGAMPTYKELMKNGVDGRQRHASRPSRRTPASAGTRWPPARGRASTARRTTRSTAPGDTFTNRTSFSARGHAPGRHDRQRGRARGQEGRADRLGRRRQPRVSTGRSSTSRTSSRTAACSSARRNATEQAGSAFFGVDLPGRRRSAAGAGWTNVPAGDPGGAAEADDVDDPRPRSPRRTRTAPTTSTSTTASTGGGANYDHAIVSPVGKTGAAPSVDLEGRRLPADEADGRRRPDRRARRPDGRPLREADLARAGPRATSSSTSPRSRARSRRAARACNGLPAGGAGEDRLEKYIADNLLPWAAADFAPRGGRRDRRGHVRRAGPRPRAGLQPRR